MKDRIKYFNNFLNLMTNEDIRILTIRAIENAPDYFYEVPASSSGRYHPMTSLGEGGLVRHTYSLCMILEELFELEWYDMTDRERDMCRCAGIVHDMCKCGDTGTHTVFNHPILAASFIEKCNEQNQNGSMVVSKDEIQEIQRCLSSHMGKWNENTRTGEKLPKPVDILQCIVHEADYIASRRFLEVRFTEEEKNILYPQIDIEDYILKFGTKHSGKKLLQVAKEDFDYVRWMYTSCELAEPLASFVKEIIEGEQHESDTIN